MHTRRLALKTIAATAAAVPAIEAQHQHPSEKLVSLKTPQKPVFFRADEYATLTILTDLIIPRSDTPGASDAGVPLLIDNAAAANARVAQRWRGALEWLDRESQQKHGRTFRTLSQWQQVAMLTAMSEAPASEGGRVFTLAKDTTIDLYYSTREGLAQELGWKGNTFLPEFKGCTHPEHQG